jgi:hypothetical protein
MTVMVKACIDACGNSYLSQYLDSLSMHGQFVNSTVHSCIDLIQVAPVSGWH